MKKKLFLLPSLLLMIILVSTYAYAVPPAPDVSDQSFLVTQPAPDELAPVSTHTTVINVKDATNTMMPGGASLADNIVASENKVAKNYNSGSIYTGEPAGVYIGNQNQDNSDNKLIRRYDNNAVAPDVAIVQRK